MRTPKWEIPKREEIPSLTQHFSRTLAAEGTSPSSIMIERDQIGSIRMIAMIYQPAHRYSCLVLKKINPESDFCETWETMLMYIRSLVGNTCAVELYPPDRDIVNTAPCRWFWLVPHTPSLFNLKSNA